MAHGWADHLSMGGPPFRSRPAMPWWCRWYGRRDEIVRYRAMAVALPTFTLLHVRRSSPL